MSEKVSEYLISHQNSTWISLLSHSNQILTWCTVLFQGHN